MPFIRTSYRQDRHSSERLQICAKALSESLIEYFRIPPDDFFQVFHAVQPDGFWFSPSYLGVERSEELLFIEITLGEGRSEERKKAFYKDAAGRIARHCGMRSEDVLIILVETRPEDWSFGLGEAQMIDMPPVWLREPRLEKPDSGQKKARKAQDRYISDLDTAADSTGKSPMKASAGQAYAHISPAFADYTQRILFGEIWSDPALSPRERSLVTLSALVALGQTAQLPYHMRLAETHGLSHSELSAVCTHLAFYAGWPRAASALETMEREIPNT